jgi:hypothetical protein
MMLMRTGRILARSVADGVVLVMAMTMTIAGVRRTRRVVGKGPRRGSEGKTTRGMGRGRGRETLKGKVLLNTPQGEMISLVSLLQKEKYEADSYTEG